LERHETTLIKIGKWKVVGWASTTTRTANHRRDLHSYGKEEGMMKGLRLVLCLLILAFVICPFAQANEQEQDVELEKTVVTATKGERPVDLVPAAVTVITREEIEKVPVQGGVDDLLQDLAGVSVRNTSGFNSDGASNSVYMRGMGGMAKQCRVLVLKDGVPLNDVHGGYVEFNEIAVEDVERIEVVRGSASSLYGSQAMGGVINIITRKPEKEFRTEINGGYGTFNTWNAGARNSATLGKFSYVISGMRLESDGYQETPAEDRTSLNSADSAIERDNFSGKIRYAFDPTCSLELSGNHHHNERTGKYNLIEDFHLFEDNIDRLNLHFNKRWKDVKLQATLFGSDLYSGYDHARYRYYDIVDYDSETNGDDIGGSFQIGFGLGQQHFLTLGGDYRKTELDKRYNYKTTYRIRNNGGNQDIYSVFAQDEIFLFAEKLILNLGARYDWWESHDGYSLDTNVSPLTQKFDDRKDSSLNPKFAARYRLTDGISLRGSVGTAFRAPTLPNLYQGDYVYGTTTYQGNPDLQPEKSVSYELGTDLKIKDVFTASVSVYQTNMEDGINLITTDPVNHIKQYKNIGEVEIKGLELEAQYRIPPDWAVYGTYTANSSKIDKFEEDRSLEGKYLPWLPKYQASIGLLYSNAGLFTARVAGRYVGTIYDDDENEEETGDYFTADLKLSRKFSNYLEASLDIFNIFDRGYQETTSTENPGRIIMGNIKLTF
jgi:iron complex outermembrane recepter protein